MVGDWVTAIEKQRNCNRGTNTGTGKGQSSLTSPTRKQPLKKGPGKELDGGVRVNLCPAAALWGLAPMRRVMVMAMIC